MLFTKHIEGAGRMLHEIPVFIRGVVLCIALFIAEGASGQVRSASVEKAYSLLHESVSFNQDSVIHYFVERNYQCRDTECYALRTIGAVDQIMNIAATTPMGIGDPSPAGFAYVARVTRPRTIMRQISAELFQHRTLFPAICARLQDMARRLPEITPPYDFDSIEHSIQIAELIASRTDRHCVEDMIKALPRSKLADGFIDAAKVSCLFRPWRNYGCRWIGRALLG